MEQKNNDFGGRVRSGIPWMVGVFGFGQLLRLSINIILAGILLEQDFALMAIVAAVLTGLGMLSAVGLDVSVVQSPKGDDQDFLSTVWTLQVIRGVIIFLFSLALAYPLSLIYGANDQQATDLLFLIPIVAVSSVVEGFRSIKFLTAKRHLKIIELSKIELIVTIFGSGLTVLLAWSMKSVYALAISSVVSSILFTSLSYLMLKGAKSSFRWHMQTIKDVASFGKWILVSTLFTFLALHADRLALGLFFPLSTVGVYSIAVSLAYIVPSVIAQIQWNLLLPWYSRMIEMGMPLPMAFGRSRAASMVLATYLCTLLVTGAPSFFELAYDNRYVLGGTLVPVLAVGAWFSCLESMYGSLFVASGRPKWTAVTSASKVVSYLLFLVPMSLFGLNIVTAALLLVLSDVVRWFVCYWLGRRLGLKSFKGEFGMFGTFFIACVAGYWMIEKMSFVSELQPFARLAILGSTITLFFMPLFLRIVLPLLRR